MSSAFNIGGLATGLDTNSIIDKLLSIDGQPKVQMQWRQQLWQSRQGVWNDLNGRLNTLGGFASKLMNPASWTVFSGINSTDNTKVTGSSVGSKPAAGTHTIDITQLATTEAWKAASNLPGATAGVRTTGVWKVAGGAAANAGTLLTSLRDSTNTSVGLNNGSQITVNYQQGGKSYSSTFNVTAASKMSDLTAFVQAQVPGATVSLSGGKISVTSPPGTSSELTALSFTATNAAGAVLARFNGSQGAASSRTTSATDGGAANADTLQITQGASTWYVNVAKGDNEAAIAAKINATTGIGVTANLSAGKLSLASNSSGAAGAFSVSSTGTLATTLGLAQTTAGQDSSFKVDGTTYTRSKNTGITDVLTDVSLDLLNPTTSTVSLTVGAAATSNDDITKQVHSFVDQYNSIIDFIGTQASQQKVVNPGNLNDYLKAPMARNYEFESVADRLRSQVGDIVSGQPSGFQTLHDIGIDTDRQGHLNIDDAKLSAALTTDRTSVQSLLNAPGTGSAEGIVRRVSDLVSQLRVGGTVDSNIKGITSQVKSLQGSIDTWTTRLDAKKKYYQHMFSSMETLVGKMQNQGNWLSSQIAGLG